MIKKLSAWTLVLFWMGVIFNFSAQNAEESSSLSQGISKFYITFLVICRE